MRACDGGFDLVEIDVDDFGVTGHRLRVEPQVLVLAIGFYECDVRFGAASGAQILQCALIDGKESA